MSNDKIKKDLSKAKYNALRVLNFERDYHPSKVQGDQGVGVVAQDNSKNRNYTNTDKQGEVLPHEANLLYGRIEENKEPVIEPVQVTEADITGKPESKKFSWKQNKDTKESTAPHRLFQRWVDNNRELINTLPRDNQFGNLGLGIAEIGQDYLDLLAHPVKTAQDLKYAAQYYGYQPSQLVDDLLKAGVYDPIKYWSDPQKMYENPAYPLQYVNNLMMALEGGRGIGKILEADKVAKDIEMLGRVGKHHYKVKRGTASEIDNEKLLGQLREMNLDKEEFPQGLLKEYENWLTDYHQNNLNSVYGEQAPSRPKIPLGLYNEASKIDPFGNLGEFVATGKIKRPSILKDSSFYPEETLVDIENLPKQSPIARVVDIPSEAPEVLYDSKLKQMAKDVTESKAAEPVKNYNKMIKEYGGVENFNKMLDEIPSGMSPEDLAKYRALWLSNQRSIMGGGGQADVLAELNRQTIVDPSLIDKKAFGSYSKGGLTPEGIEEVTPSLKDVNKDIDFSKGVYRILPEGVLRKDTRRPFLDIGKQDVPATDTYYHELTHGVNDLADELQTKAAIDYARRYNYPNPTNESASLGMESLDLTNEAVDPRLINAYKQAGYNAELSNPSMQKYRELYQQDIDRYKKMIDLGLIKVDEPTIFNEEALMRRLDPNYISPEVQKYLYNIDDIGTGKMFEGFNGQW